MTDTAFEIAYLTADRDKERRAAEAWARAAENERMSTRVAIGQRDAARADAAARATEHARAIVAGIAGAMGLDTSGEGDEIHARILAEHARLAGAVAAERARCVARVRDVGEQWSGLKQTATTRAVFAVINAARRGIESGDTGADPDVVLTAVARLTRERDEARAAIRADLHCDECHAVATRSRRAPARKYGGDDYACDAHSVAPEASDGYWTDLPHAAAVRAAMETP